MSKIMISPEVFWQVYSAKLNELECKKFEVNNKSISVYLCDSQWTPHVMGAAEAACKEFGLQTQNEYYRVDLMGWTQQRDETDSNALHKWDLNIAYEHENGKRWDDELCKLCYVAADLKVISAYHDFAKKETIIDYLSKCLENLGKEKIFRVPDSKWLFVFGPRQVDTEERKEHKFKAFAVDKELNIVPIMTGEKVQPGLWLI